MTTTPDNVTNTALALRTIAELSQSRAAQLIGVSDRQWRRWENGGSPMPAKKVEAFKAAVKALDNTSTTGVLELQAQLHYEKVCEMGRNMDPELKAIIFPKKYGPNGTLARAASVKQPFVPPHIHYSNAMAGPFVPIKGEATLEEIAAFKKEMQEAQAKLDAKEKAAKRAIGILSDGSVLRDT